MKLKTILIKTGILAALPLLALKMAGAQAQPKGAAIDAIRSKVALEAQIEERLRQMLTAYLNTKDLAVAVKVNMLLKKPEEQAGSAVRKWNEKEEIVLPGVPAATSMTKESSGADAAAKKAVRLGVSSIDIWVIVGKQVPKDREEKIRQLITAALDLDVAAGDTVKIEGSVPVKPDTVGSPGALVALICLLVIGIFLYGPFRSFLKRLPEALTAMAPAKAAAPAAGGTALSINGEEGAESTMTGALSISGGGGGAGASVLTFGGDENMPLDQYVTKDNIDDLRLILLNETPEVIAKVVQRIPQKLAFEAIPKLQMKDVLGQYLKRSFEEPEAIKKLLDGIRDKMAGSFGGETRMANLLQIMDKKSQERTLAFIREKDATFATALESRFFKFDDLLRYDETAVRRIFRKAGAEPFACCMKNCDEPTREAFFEMLGPAIKALVAARIDNIMLAVDSNDSELIILNAVNALAAKGLVLPLAEVKKAEFA